MPLGMSPCSFSIFGQYRLESFGNVIRPFCTVHNPRIGAARRTPAYLTRSATMLINRKPFVWPASRVRCALRESLSGCRAATSRTFLRRPRTNCTPSGTAVTVPRQCDSTAMIVLHSSHVNKPEMAPMFRAKQRLANRFCRLNNA